MQHEKMHHNIDKSWILNLQESVYVQYVSNSTEFQVKDNSKTTQNKNARREELFGKFIRYLTKAEIIKQHLKSVNNSLKFGMHYPC